MLIRKAIIPVAGFGTRFLPATKAQPKEMLPIVDKPIIQYLVEEAVASGIEEIIFITGRGKRAIEDHFDHSFELEHNLVEKGKHNLLKNIYKISKLASFAYVRQPEPLGDGHAILCAKRLVNDEPCAVLFGDDIVHNKIPCLKQLIAVYEKYMDAVVALEEVPIEEVSKFGVVKPRPGKNTGSKTFEVEDIVEKPSVKKAPSNLIIVGKYIITPRVFEILEAIAKHNLEGAPKEGLTPPRPPSRPVARERHRSRGNGGEIRLADALKKLANEKTVYGHKFDGVRYDCGSKLGFLKATVDFGLRHEEVGKEFGEFLKGKK